MLLAMRPVLLPYTTLFRSQALHIATKELYSGEQVMSQCRGLRRLRVRVRRHDGMQVSGRDIEQHRPRVCGRSEEHTSELQSLTNLVCRLLLDKKKKDGNRI